MIKKVEDDTKASQPDYFEHLQIVYGFALKEVIRQISLHCQDLGLLLDQVWRGFLVLIEQNNTNFESTIKEMDCNIDKIIERKYSQRKGRIEELEVKVLQLNQQHEEDRLLIRKQLNNLIYFKKKISQNEITQKQRNAKMNIMD